ncbi:MAG TPA: hypothetical protein DCS09_11400 [Porphyromonadaceae bacterium]|nr:hypothetical protein [Porphyromonadaceae bacterium]
MIDTNFPGPVTSASAAMNWQHRDPGFVTVIFAKIYFILLSQVAEIMQRRVCNHAKYDLVFADYSIYPAYYKKTH